MDKIKVVIDSPWFTPIMIAVLTGVIYLIMRARIIALPCLGCSEGGWWYRCMAGTGKGSVSCDVYKKTLATINQIEEESKELYRLTKGLGEKVEKPIEQALNEIRNIKNKIPSKIPKPKVPKIPHVDINCEIKIPVINKTIKPCHELTGVINGATNDLSDDIQKVIDSVVDVINGLISDVNKGVIELTDDLVKAFDLILPFKQLEAEMTAISQKAHSITSQMRTLGVFSSIKFGLIRTLSRWIPIRDLGILTAIALIILLLPVIGNLYGSYQILNAMVGGYLAKIIVILTGVLISLIFITDAFGVDEWLERELKLLK